MLDYDGRRLGSQIANQFWHSDSSFSKSVAKYSILSARKIPKREGILSLLTFVLLTMNCLMTLR